MENMTNTNNNTNTNTTTDFINLGGRKLRSL